jgi:hypothetical protein
MTKSEVFFREFIVGLGFISGFWIALGVNPEAIIFESLRTVMETLNPDSGFSFMFTLFPLLLTIGSVVGAYAMGGKIGMIAIGIAFVGGLLLISAPLFSVILMVIAMMIGSVAVENNQAGAWF